METKKWWQSRTLWIAVVTTLLTGVETIGPAVGHPIKIPPVVYQVLTAMGLYTARTAEKPIS